MPLDATVGGSNSNSYGTLVEANSYFADHWNTAKSTEWAGLSDRQKDRLLISACRLLETIRVLDQPYTRGRLPLALLTVDTRDTMIHRQLMDQRLQFPRNIDIQLGGDALPIIPEEIKEAQFEQAIYLKVFDEAQLADRLQGIEQQEVAAGGGVRVWTKYSEGGRGNMFAPMTIELMEPYLRRSQRWERA
jgi:hypothetical protein